MAKVLVSDSIDPVGVEILSQVAQDNSLNLDSPKGSCSNTSKAAPAILPDSRASIKAN